MSYAKLAQSVKFGTKRSGAVKVIEKDSALEFIGLGRSAFAYRIKSSNIVVKIFFPPFAHLAEEEADIYRSLQGTSYYPTLYEVGPNYLVMDYIDGHTLFDCIRKGIKITEKHIHEVDKALSVARKKGMNPSDIHLRNIIITTEGKIKMIDVVRFRQSKNCTQWDDLKSAFYRFYNLPFFPKKIPAVILNFTAAMYKRNLLRFVPGLKA